jgi:biopolymer transport protein ExbD
VLLRHITIEVPRKLEADEQVVSTSTQIIVLGKADGSIEIDDGSGKVSVNRVELAKTLRPMLDKIKSEKVVFVDFEDSLGYADVVSIMDTVKGFERRDGTNVLEPVKVALKIRDPNAQPAQ